MKSIEDTLLLTHNPTPWHQNATIESFRLEGHYEDEIWLEVFFVFDNCCFSFFVLFCFYFVLKHKLDNAEASISMFLPEKTARLFL